jgi:hypothetical protein
MIEERNLRAAKRNHYLSIPIEQTKYFMEALRDRKHYWIYRDGQWQPRKRKPQSEETKAKISEAMKGNQNAKKDYSLVSSSSGTSTGSSGMSGVLSSGSGTV